MKYLLYKERLATIDHDDDNVFFGYMLDSDVPTSFHEDTPARMLKEFLYIVENS